jgi:glutathione S-transferase
MGAPTAPAIRLYHCPDARSFRVLWTLEEMACGMNSSCCRSPRVHAREYLSINLLGTVLTFFDGDMRMTESVAICQYLVNATARRTSTLSTIRNMEPI